MMPAPLATALNPPELVGSRVPAEWTGRARVLRNKIADAYVLFSDSAERLIAPLRTRDDFSPTFTKQSLSITAARWKSLPVFGRLRLVARNDGTKLQILETRIIPFRAAMADWSEFELSLAVTLTVLLMERPATFVETTKLIAVIGLHALGRRFERGADRSDVAVFCDLSVFGNAWPSAVRSGSFDIPAQDGGNWRGTVMSTGGQPVLAIRTFVA